MRFTKTFFLAFFFVLVSFSILSAKDIENPYVNSPHRFHVSTIDSISGLGIHGQFKIEADVRFSVSSPSLVHNIEHSSSNYVTSFSTDTPSYPEVCNGDTGVPITYLGGTWRVSFEVQDGYEYDSYQSNVYRDCYNSNLFHTSSYNPFVLNTQTMMNEFIIVLIRRP